mgnify:CR=1 FL=1
MNLGACFGKMYQWKQKLIPLALEETLLAVLPEKEYCKIPLYLGIEKELIVKELRHIGIFPKFQKGLGLGQKEMGGGKLEESCWKEQQVQQVSNTDIFEASQGCSLVKVPYGSYLIQEG